MERAGLSQAVPEKFLSILRPGPMFSIMSLTLAAAAGEIAGELTGPRWSVN